VAILVQRNTNNFNATPSRNVADFINDCRSANGHEDYCPGNNTQLFTAMLKKSMSALLNSSNQKMKFILHMVHIFGVIREI